VRISPRQSLHLLKVDGREFLIGSTDQTINLLAEMEAGFGQTEFESPMKAEALNSSFNDLLKKSIDKQPDSGMLRK
jgi:flagellar biogenesis protein FliO